MIAIRNLRDLCRFTTVLKLTVLLTVLLPLSMMAQSSESGTESLLEKTKFNKRRGNLEGAIGFGLLGLDQAKTQDNEELIYEFDIILGDIFLAKKDYKKAIYHYAGITVSSQKNRKYEQLANGFFGLAQTYTYMGAYEKASGYYEKAYDIYDKTNDKKGKADALHALGENYIKSNQSTKAIPVYEKLLKQVIAGKLYSYVGEAQEILFNQNRILGNTEESITYGLAYYERIKDRGDNAKIGETADQIAGEYLKADQNKNALKYANIAVQKDPNRTDFLVNLAKAYSVNGDYAKAMSILQGAAEDNEKRRKIIDVAENYNVMAQIAYDNMDYRSATTYLEKAEKIGTEKTSRKTLYETYRLFALTNEKKGSISMRDEYNKMRDAVKLQLGESDQLVSKVSASKENLAESYEQEARALISAEENEKLAKERTVLQSQQKLKEIELIEHRSKLKDIELEQQVLEADRARQQLLIAEKNGEVAMRQAELIELQKDADLRKLQEEENKRRLELSEKQRQLLEQQKEFESVRAKQAKQLQYLIIGASILILAILSIAFYRTYNNGKTIREQNQNLAEQQKTILNRNIQLKKSSEAMLAMNNNLKKAHVNLKVVLKKEQSIREELEKANKEIKNTQVHLVQAEKMSSLGLLTAGIAHEINNPVNFVSSGTQSLMQNFSEINSFIENYQKVLALDDFEQIKKYRNILQEDEESLQELVDSSQELLTDVNYGINRITEIVNGLRSFSRHDEAEIKDADINQSFDAALLILKNKYKNKAEIVLDMDESLPMIQCFPGQLNQVFVNLINNALDAMNEGGEIKIQTKDLNDRWIQIKIQDNGTGMPNEVKEKIFDPFFTTKEIGKGTGLGLSISHGIIEKHNGSIQVESEVGVGTTFIIKLPKKLELDDKILEEQLL